jgi:cellulose synthase/poly-beta-1,6-N-acetylglucosamine synthase-like glycosyltransferase
MDKKISFLIAAHNEEKIIGGTLDHLLHLAYPNYEIIIGLDGCTDNTEKIVKEYAKKSKKISYYSLNLRKGKPAVINNIIKKSKGEIIIINDADWILKVKEKNGLKKMIGVFNDPFVGGIAESYPVEWDKEKIMKGNIWYKMTAHSSNLWFNFQKKKFSKNEGKISVLTSPGLFMTNIFRKRLYKENTMLADDFERTEDIMDAGYKVVFFNSESSPRMTAVYDKIYLKDIIKQKIRTATARNQLKNKSGKIDSKNYYIPSVIYIVSAGFKKSFTIGLLMLLWVFIQLMGTTIASLKKLDTKEGWKLRMRR